MNAMPASAASTCTGCRPATLTVTRWVMTPSRLRTWSPEELPGERLAQTARGDVGHAVARHDDVALGDVHDSGACGVHQDGDLGVERRVGADLDLGAAGGGVAQRGGERVEVPRLHEAELELVDVQH